MFDHQVGIVDKVFFECANSSYPDELAVGDGSLLMSGMERSIV